MKKFSQVILILIGALISSNLLANSEIIQCPATAECVGHAPNQSCYTIGQYNEFFDKYIPPIEAAKVEGKYNLSHSVNLKNNIVNCLYLYGDGSDENYPALAIKGKTKNHFTANISPDSGWGATSQQDQNNNYCSILTGGKCPLNVN